MNSVASMKSNIISCSSFVSNRKTINNKPNPNVLIVTPSQYETAHLQRTKRVFEVFGIDSREIVSSVYCRDESDHTVCVKNICFYTDHYDCSAIMCYDHGSRDFVNRIAQGTILPTIYISSKKKDPKQLTGHPVVTFPDDSSINAAIFLVQILSLKYASILYKLQQMQRSK
jgi:phosphoribosylcarboxyaminoimidazole (NCAIR) mutase